MKEEETNLDIFNRIVTALSGLDSDTQIRTLQSVVTFLNIPWPMGTYQSLKQTDLPTTSDSKVSFSEDRSISAKAFVRDKQPKTDIERIACLAYYLTHYKDTPYFKTIDLSTLNTEAAQPKFSNATLAVNNATIAGMLVPAEKGSKQISAAGEAFVLALPDRDAAKEVLANLRFRKRPRKNRK